MISAVAISSYLRLTRKQSHFKTFEISWLLMLNADDIQQWCVKIKYMSSIN